MLHSINTHFSGIRTRKMLLTHFLPLKTKMKKRKKKKRRPPDRVNKIFLFTLTPGKFNVKCYAHM